MFKSLNMSDEPKPDILNKLNRIPMYMNDKFPFMVSYDYCIRQ
jgi:hypothetical protein